MSGTSWRRRTLSDRYRAIEADARSSKIGLVGVLATTWSQVILGAWIVIWAMALFEILALSLITSDRRFPTSIRLGRGNGIALTTLVLVFGFVVALSGGPRSPDIPLMVLPVGMIAARFRLRSVLAALGLTIAVTLAATFGVHPRWAIEEPMPLIAKLALIAAVVMSAWGLRAGGLLHGDESVLDPLTGLLNRGGLRPHFAEVADLLSLKGEPVSMIACDVDGLGRINAEHGRARGDLILREVADALRKSLHPYALLYRLWGGGFVVVLPGIGLHAASRTAERLHEAVEEARPTDLAVTISLGVSAARGASVDFEELFEETGEALCWAKRTGRNCIASTDRGFPCSTAGPSGRLRRGRAARLASRPHR